MLIAPEPLSEHHQTDAFDCEIASLNDWLKRRAAQNQLSGASRTFVCCDGKAVIGYYAVASSAVTTSEAPGRFRRNMPDPIPVVVLARLAVASTYQQHGLGRALFRDAVHRVIQAADLIGVRGLVVHALDEQAKAFYLQIGLDESPIEPLTLMATLANLKSTIQ